jgi:hypothetical protein
MKLAHAMEMAPQNLEDSMTPQELEMDSSTPQELELDSSAQRDFVPDSPPDSQPHPCVCCGMIHDCNDVEGCRRLAASLAGAPVEIKLSKTAMQNALRSNPAKSPCKTRARS